MFEIEKLPDEVLHISNDFAGSKVYSYLVKELDIKNVPQIIYSPVKSRASIGKNKVEFGNANSKIIYSKILNKHYDRLLYRRKIRKIVKDIESKIDLSKISLIHAHTWYSDGGVAYLLHKKFDIPYLVTIRSSDLNFFQKYLIHQRPFGRKILMNAEYIILISGSSEVKLLKTRSLKPVIKEISKKMKVIPNGVDQYWITNSKPYVSSRKNGNDITALYIGRFLKEKNILSLQKAVIHLNEVKGLKIKLHIVGGDGPVTRHVLHFVEKFPTLFEYHGQVNNKRQLLQIFRKVDFFAMPSRYETFGLVYIEALLQGLPILYTQGEGIDGFYEENIGEKLTVFTPNEIGKKIIKMATNLNSYEIPLEKIRKNHDWREISQKFIEMYSEIRGSRL